MSVGLYHPCAVADKGGGDYNSDSGIVPFYFVCFICFPDISIYYNVVVIMTRILRIIRVIRFTVWLLECDVCDPFH